MQGVINVNQNSIDLLPPNVVAKIESVEHKKTRLVHYSDFTRLLVYKMINETQVIYSDLDEIVFKPIHRCNFFTLATVSGS